MEKQELSNSKFDAEDVLLLDFLKIRSIIDDAKAYVPLSAIVIEKDLSVYINPTKIYSDRTILGKFLEVNYRNNGSFKLKNLGNIIDDVRNFKNYDDIHLNERIYILRTGKNSVSAIITNDEKYRIIGTKKLSKLNTLFNTALYYEEYELASIVNRKLQRIFSSEVNTSPFAKGLYKKLLK